jgi:hypothetical protein
MSKRDERLPFQDTEVPYTRTIGEIIDLLTQHGYRGTAYPVPDREGHGGEISVQFEAAVDGSLVPFCIRRRFLTRTKGERGNADQVARALLNTLKGQLVELACNAALSPVEVFAGALVLPDGQTMYAHLSPRLPELARGEVDVLRRMLPGSRE